MIRCFCIYQIHFLNNRKLTILNFFCIQLTLTQILRYPLLLIALCARILLTFDFQKLIAPSIGIIYVHYLGGGDIRPSLKKIGIMVRQYDVCLSDVNNWRICDIVKLAKCIIILVCIYLGKLIDWHFNLIILFKSSYISLKHIIIVIIIINKNSTSYFSHILKRSIIIFFVAVFEYLGVKENRRFNVILFWKWWLGRRPYRHHLQVQILIVTS